VKKLIAVLAALPILAFAQGGAPKEGSGAAGKGAGPDRGRVAARMDAEHMEKRARLALTLGLATALDLDEAQALRLGETVAKFTDRRRALHDQMRDARGTLMKAAQGEKIAAGDVDLAIAKLLDGRAQTQTIDRELVTTVTRDLTPEKKARAVLFLSRFQRRFGAGGPGQHGMHGGPGGPGMRGGPATGMMMEHGPAPMAAMGRGPGGMGMDPGDWDDED
jgi:hypothetical protein